MMAAGAGLLSFNTAKAQLGLHLNLHLGGVAVHAVYNAPVPVDYTSYDNGDDYYYMPDVEAYYSVPQHRYYYNDGNSWVSAAYLPGRYHDFDWRTARHYEIHGDRPFMHHDMYRTRYGGFDHRGGGYADNHFNNRGTQFQGGYDTPRGGDNRNFGEQNRGDFNQNRNNDNRGDQFRGGFDNQDRRARGAYQPQGGDMNQNRGGMNQQPSNNNGSGQYQNGNMNQNRGGMNQQPSNNSGGGQNQNGSQSRGNSGQQPSNQNAQPSNQNGGSHERNGIGTGDHFAANKMGFARTGAL